MRTFLVGKIGRSVRFNSDSWSAVGGDCEAPELLRKMAELNPNDTFIIISRNDVDRNRDALNLPANLVDIYNGATTDEKKDYHYITKRLKDTKIDGCFLMSGPIGILCNIPEKAWKRTELKHGHKVHTKTLATFIRGVAPIYNFLNDTNIPWVMIANDPRYIIQGNDLMNQPKMILSQYDEIIKMKTFDNWEDQNYIKNDITSIYAGMEKMFLIDKQIPTSFKKTKKFMVVLNEGNNGVKSRYTELKKYVLDYIDDVEIYGKWDESVLLDTRFKGSVKFTELQSMLPSVKYSFMISITDGWVTMKVWELLAHGIIPFMHPNYDTQKHCNLPDFIRVNNPTELHEKIEFLENNPEEYARILKECLSQITIDDTSGTALSSTILSYTPIVNKQGVKFETITNINSNIDEW